MVDFQRRDVCPCGWSFKPSFGDKWFSDNKFPCCPDCGLDCSEREMQTGEIIRVPGNRWWNCSSYVWQELKET